MTDISRIFPTRLNFPVAGATMMIEVDSSNPSWSPSSIGRWGKTEKVTNGVKVTVYANDTSQLRSTSVTIVSGDDMDDTEEVPIYQSCEFNAENLILPQKQISTTGCLLTCAAMCICQTQEQLDEDGFSLDEVENWNKLMKTYGYNVKTYDNHSLEQVYEILKQGYPVISYINNSNDLHLKHCVTIYKYSGTSKDGKNLNASDFMCVDPKYNNKCPLNKALNYTGIYTVYVCRQNTCS